MRIKINKVSHLLSQLIFIHNNNPAQKVEIFCSKKRNGKQIIKVELTDKLYKKARKIK